MSKDPQKQLEQLYSQHKKAMQAMIQLKIHEKAIEEFKNKSKLHLFEDLSSDVMVARTKMRVTQEYQKFNEKYTRLRDSGDYSEEHMQQMDAYFKSIKEAIADDSLYSAVAANPVGAIYFGANGYCSSYPEHKQYEDVYAKAEQNLDKGGKQRSVYVPEIIKAKLFEKRQYAHIRNPDPDIKRDLGLTEFRAGLQLLQKHDTQAFDSFYRMIADLEHGKLDLQDAINVLSSTSIPESLMLDINMFVAIEMVKGSLAIENAEKSDELWQYFNKCSHTRTNSIDREMVLLQELGAENYQKAKMLHNAGMKISVISSGGFEKIEDSDIAEVRDFAATIKDDLSKLDLAMMHKHKQQLAKVIASTIEPGNAMLRKVSALANKVKKYFSARARQAIVMNQDVKSIVRTTVNKNAELRSKRSYRIGK